jgi:GNAT superfamily N-acetyltransferase
MRIGGRWDSGMLLESQFFRAIAMRLRVMTMKDIPAGVRLNTVAGWNQTEADWNRFLAGSPQGCFVMEEREKVVGTAATFSYENRFAWISMVLVDPEYRNRGIGTKLLHRTVDYLNDAGIPTLKLDATPLGKPLYEKMGFVSEYEIDRWILKRAGDRDLAVKATWSRVGQLPEIFQFDREIFGADRSGLLRSLDERAPDLTLAEEGGSHLRGYAFGRHGLFADHLGPWMAPDRNSAEILLAEFLRRSSRVTIIVDALKSSRIAGEILRNHGFSPARPLTRMYRGPNAFPGRADLLCAIAGPEFG